MAGLNNIREAYEQVYAEALSADEKALRRELAADKRASKMAPSVASKYASSEAQSAKRADTKSKGKHIHGTVDEEHESHPPRTRKPSQMKKMQHLKDLLDKKKEETKEEFEVEEAYEPISKEKENRMYRRAGNLARTALSSTGKKKQEAQTKSANIVSAITRQKERERFDRIGQSPAHNEEFVAERELDPTETREKERLVKGLKKSASDFKKRYGERAKSVMYATATKMAKERMDTSKSDRRYSVER